MSRLGPGVAPFMRASAPPSAESVEKLSLRLSIVAIAGVVALVLIYYSPTFQAQARRAHRDPTDEACSCYRPETGPRAIWIDQLIYF